MTDEAHDDPVAGVDALVAAVGPRGLHLLRSTFATWCWWPGRGWPA